MIKQLHFLTLCILAILIVTGCNLYSQSNMPMPTESVEMEQFDFSTRYLKTQKPALYRLASQLTQTEVHVLDTLSAAERRFIEESVDPPMVGVIRNLPEPVVFDLTGIVIPDKGEVSAAGGRISRIHEDTLVYTTRFISWKADQLRVFFESGYFPGGVQVNVFGDNGQAFRQQELSGLLDEYGFYTTSLFSGALTIQVVIPLNSKDERSISFTISKIIHVDERYIEKENLRDCYIDANCPYANEFTYINQLRRSTAFLYFPVGAGYAICTGGLLNDARTKDFQPYLLTANHCFDTQTSAAGLEAVFYYYSKACNNDTANPSIVVVNGSNLIATNPDTDFTLVLLRNLGGDTYLGWTTNNVGNGETMHAVHHPGGRLQKYSRFKNLYTPEYDCDNLPISRYFHTTTYAGQNSGGSSGGVIVTPGGYVVGQLYGKCHEPSWDECNFSSFDGIWGKFALSYANNNLQYWLNSSMGGNGAVLTTIPSTSWDFGTADVGGANTFPFSVNNTGTRPNNLNLEVYSISVTGPDAADFYIIGETSYYLSPGFGGSFQVRFSPSSAGPKSAQLVITHNADNVASPKIIPLTGYGNPCSDIIDMGYGGFSNAQLFSRTGTGIWNTGTNSACGYACPGIEQIYTFTAPLTGIYRLEVPLTNNTWVDYMYRTGTCSSTGWTCIDDIYSQGTYGTLNLTQGVQYQLLLDPETTSQVTHAFYIAYDPCQNIINLGGTGSSYQQTYNGGYNGSWYTNSSTPCGTLAAGLEQIYSFTPVITGNYSVQVTAASGQTAYLWKSGSCSSSGWNCLQNISAPGKYGNLILTAFTTYYFMLADVDNTPGAHKFYIDFAEAPGTWKGTVSNDWHNPANWSAGILPTSTTDVIIPWASPFRMPVISNNNASCRFLVINPSASLTIGNYNLNVNLDVTIHGTLVMNGAAGKLNVLRDVFWENGSTANFSAAAECYVNGDWRVNAGANCNLAAGTVRFTGSSPSIIGNWGNVSELSFNNVNIEKTGSQSVTISGTKDVTIKGNLYVQNGAQLNITTPFVIYIFGNISVNGQLNCSAGTVTLKGVNQFIKPNVNDFFHHLEFNQSGTVLIDNIQTSVLKANGRITITSGILNAQNRTIQVGQDWKNTAGDAAFQETGSRVVFNGVADQNIQSSETFNILEVNTGGLIRINNPDISVSCSQYDWTSGGIEVQAGTFTANDLFDNGIFGNYTLHEGGIINLTNDQWIDLNGNLLINGGQFNIYGGSADSDWPYAANGSLTMYDGVLDFKNRGIRILNSTSYTFESYIEGGLIRTAGSINNMSPGFVNLGSTFEMYSSADANLSTATDCQLGNVIINKGAFDGEVALPSITDKEGNKAPQTRASAVYVFSNQLRIDGSLMLNAGTFDLNASTVYCYQGITINAATLKMTQAPDYLSVPSIIWNDGSQTVITHGVISATNWKFNNGTQAKLGAGNTAQIRNFTLSEDDDAEFGNLTIVASPVANPLHNRDVTDYFPTRVAGNLLIESGAVVPQLATDLLVGYSATLQPGVVLSMTSGADFSVGGNLIVQGTLDLSGGNVLMVYGGVSVDNGGTLTLGASSVFELYSDLTVGSNGSFLSAGAEGQEVLVTRGNDGKYSFSAEPGGNLSAEHTVFEHMNILGINIKEGAFVDPAKAFNYCTFREGQPYGVLLTLNSAQDLVSTGAVFPGNTWSGLYNVARTVNSGSITFSQFSGEYSGQEFENDPFNRINWQGTPVVHNILLPAGWSGLSSWVMPSGSNIEDIFAQVAPAFVIAQTLTGYYYPQAGVNTLRGWNSHSAYQVKMSGEAVLPITGFEENNKEFILNEGWNLLPVICNVPVDAAALFEGLSTDVGIIKEIAGNKIFWPEFGINTLQQLLPGRAYFVKMYATGTITYPPNTDEGYIPKNEAVVKLITPWNSITETYGSHIFGLTLEAMNDLEPGDIIGTFTSEEICVGIFQINKMTENATLSAFADDPMTPQKDGFSQDDQLFLKLFRPSTGEEWLLKAVFDQNQPNHDGTFAIDGVSVINQLKLGTADISEVYQGISVFPNPTSDVVNIKNIAGVENIAIANVAGSIVKTVHGNGQNEIVIDFSGLPAGIYQLKLLSEKGLIVKKIVKQ